MATRTWPALLTTLMGGADLAAEDTAWAMDEVMTGNATPAQLAAFAVLLRAKGETPQELSGLVRTMIEHAAPVTIEGRAVDVVGTGADRAHTVNISTMAALVVAGSGRRVVKHGNRAATSSCGSADVLEELGVIVDLPAAGVAHTVAEAGIGFCFAPGVQRPRGPRRARRWIARRPRCGAAQCGGRDRRLRRAHRRTTARRAGAWAAAGRGVGRLRRRRAGARPLGRVQPHRRELTHPFVEWSVRT